MLVEAGRDMQIPIASDHIRVLLIDTHAVVRTGLRLLLERQPNMLVVGEAKPGAEALAVAVEEHPDIILLSLNRHDGSGLDLIPGLLRAAKEARVLVLTGMRDPQLHQQAVCLGAMGVVLKEHSAEVVIKAIEKVHAGEVWIDRTVMASVLTNLARGQAVQAVDPATAKIAALTEREREVIRLIGEGLKNKQIAERLYISETTVRHHLTAIFSKLSVADRLELVIYAYRYGLATSPASPTLRG
jgi:two-component system nitrate/nitrite response regulator NarL